MHPAVPYGFGSTSVLVIKRSVMVFIVSLHVCFAFVSNKSIIQVLLLFLLIKLKDNVGNLHWYWHFDKHMCHRQNIIWIIRCEHNIQSLLCLTYDIQHICQCLWQFVEICSIDLKRGFDCVSINKLVHKLKHISISEHYVSLDYLLFCLIDS